MGGECAEKSRMIASAAGRAYEYFGFPVKSGATWFPSMLRLRISGRPCRCKNDRHNQREGHAMSHKHRNVLEAIFRDPISSNIQWREVESLLNHLGASVDPSHGARFRVVLNRHEFFVHHPHHGNEFLKTEVKHLRECLAAAGVSLSAYDEAQR